MGAEDRLDIDLQHLRAFEATYRLRSLTRAAMELDLTQPALSKSLRTLRERFGDPLFVRTPRGMEPTPRTEEMIGAVRRALRIVDVELRSRTTFDPASDTRVFSFYASDLGTLHFLQPYLAYAARHAPGLQFRVVSLAGANMPVGLAEEVDLAVGGFPEFGAGIFQQRLFADPYVCLVSADHPRIGERFTLEDYARERHIVASVAGTGHQHAQVESRILEACGAGRIAARAPSFLALPFMLRGTAYVFTLPEAHARRFLVLGGLRIVPCPLPLAPLEIYQYWHERKHHDPAHRWFRQLTFELFAAGDAAAAA